VDPEAAGGIRTGVYRREESAYDAVERDVLPEPPQRPEARVFQALTVSAVRAVVSRQAAKAGMDAARRSDLVLAANEIATNSVRHAGGWGLLRVWRDADALVCEVADHGSGLGALPAPRRPQTDQAGGYGLWLANELCERVEVSAAGGGTTVRLRMPL
jgi:serine/threonine-protein kinase RsbW